MVPFTPFVLCIIVAGALAQSPFRIMTVTVPRPEVPANTGSDIELPCSYNIPAAPSGLNPTITWYKGDDGIASATKIFSLSYHGSTQIAEAYEGYELRVSLESLTDPTLKLSGVRASDHGRYWCAVFDSDEHNQFGMDSKSVLLTVIDPSVQQDQAVGRPGRVELRVPAVRQVYQGEDVELPCECDDCHWTSTKTWFTMSFDDTWAATEELIATVGPCMGHQQCHGGTTTVAPEFRDRFTATSGALKISSTKRLDKRRYWCQVEDMTYSRGSGVDAQSVALAVESRCTGKPAGRYQHPDDCSKYYTCGEGGLQYDGISTCPPGLMFDQALSYCNWATLVTCL